MFINLFEFLRGVIELYTNDSYEFLTFSNNINVMFVYQYGTREQLVNNLNNTK